jgi:hypothetical protein
VSSILTGSTIFAELSYRLETLARVLDDAMPRRGSRSTYA